MQNLFQKTVVAEVEPWIRCYEEGRESEYAIVDDKGWEEGE